VAKNPAATVEYWNKNPDSVVAVLGLRMLAGEWTQADDVPAGRSKSLLGQTVGVLRAAGYDVETMRAPTGGGNRRAFRVRQVGERKTGARAGLLGPPRGRVASAPVAVENAGTTHPQLGAKLTVRALALDDRGHLVVHLSNGHGAAWAARITGHVDT
jgi:hypothetical protein